MKPSLNLVAGTFRGGEIEPGTFHGAEIEPGTFHQFVPDPDGATDRLETDSGLPTGSVPPPKLAAPAMSKSAADVDTETEEAFE